MRTTVATLWSCGQLEMSRISAQCSPSFLCHGYITYRSIFLFHFLSTFRLGRRSLWSFTCDRPWPEALPRSRSRVMGLSKRTSVHCEYGSHRAWTLTTATSSSTYPTHLSLFSSQPSSTLPPSIFPHLYPRSISHRNRIYRTGKHGGA